MKTVTKYEDLTGAIAMEDLVFVYLSQPACSVCQTLLPKVEDLMKDYPLVKSWYLNTADVPEAAGQLSVFTIPTVLFFVQGKEQFRLVRAFGLQEIKEKIERVYEYFS